MNQINFSEPKSWNQPALTVLCLKHNPSFTGKEGQQIAPLFSLQKHGLIIVITDAISWPTVLESGNIGNWRLVDTLSVFCPSTLKLTSKVLLLRHRGERGRFTALDYKKQVHADILISQESRVIDEVVRILHLMTPNIKLKYFISNHRNPSENEGWKVIKPSYFESSICTTKVLCRTFQVPESMVFAKMNDEDVEKLKNPSEFSKPILVEEIGDEMPPEIPEFGIGENLTSDSHNICHKGPEDPTSEKCKIHSIIEEKWRSIDRNIASKLKFTPETLRLYLQILKDNWMAFGTEDSLSCLSDLSPFHAVLKPGAKLPYVRRTIPLNQEKLQFLEGHLKMMERKGLITRVKNPKFGCAIFLVPKKGPKKWRMVADMVPLNKVCERSPLQLPLLEQMLGFMGKSRIYSTWDLLSGFNLLRTTSDLFVIITPFGAFKMNSAPMGWLNTPAIFQDRVVSEVLIPAQLYLQYDNGAALWIDDTLLYGCDPQSFLSTTTRFLKSLINKKVRLNIRKCEFLLEKACWCGRVISEGRWTFDEKYYNSILKTPKPRYRDELLQAFYVANWLSPTIQEMAETRSTFKSMLNLGGNKVAKIKRENQLIHWTPELNRAWILFIKAIFKASQRNLKNYNPKEGLALFVDASDKFYSLVVAQITEPEEGKHIDPLKVNPKSMMFLSGEFVDSQVNWHISQKELFPIIHAFHRLDFLLLTHGKAIHVFTDHRNLVFILRPEWEPHKSHAQRLFRWSTLIQSAWMWIHHIPGEKNFLADLLSRWGNPAEEFDESLPSLTVGPERSKDSKPRKTQTLKVLRLSRVAKSKCKRRIKELYETENLESEDEEEESIGPISGSISENMVEALQRFDDNRISFLNPHSPVVFKRLSLSQIYKWQNESTTKPKGLKQGKGDLLYKKDKIWIPEEAIEHLIVHNHIASNHDSLNQEIENLRKYYFGTYRVLELVRKMRSKCIHCQRSPHILKRPYQLTKLPTKCRSVLTSDYLYVKDKNYLLVLVDVFSRKTCLKFCTEASSANVVEMLLSFRGSFGLEENFLLVTDQGSHFANAAMTELQEKLRFTQHFSVAYCPWQNGAAEVTNKKILKLIRQLCSEYSLQLDDWKNLIPTLEHVLNNSRNKNNDNLTPNEIFMGYKYNQELIQEDLDLTYIEKRLQKPFDRNSVLSYCEKLKERLHEISVRNYDYVTLARARIRAHHNKSRAYTLQFSEGDWVLVSYHNTARDVDKTRLKWVGPQQIVEVLSPDVYRVRNLLGNESTIHASRMWFYEGKGYVPDASMTSVFTHDFMELELRKILSHREQRGTTELLIDWLGLEASDRSWEPALTIAETHAQEILNYFDSIKVELPDDLKHLRRSINKILLLQDKDLERTIVSPSVLKAIGWSSLELDVLRLAILKYGFGCWHQLAEVIPSRSSQQIYNKLQWILFRTEFAILGGLRFDILSIHNLLVHRRDNGNYKNLTRSEVEMYQTNQDKNEIEIPFIPRVNLANKEKDRDLQHVLKGIQAFLVKAVDDNVFCRLREQVQVQGKNLSDCSLDLRETLTVKLDDRIFCEGDIILRQTDNEPTSFSLDENGFFGERSYVDERFYIQFDLNWLASSQRRRFRSLKQVVLGFVTNNLYRVSCIDGQCYDFMVVPQQAIPVEMKITKETWKLFVQKEGLFDVLHIDPPWKVGRGNPAYGFSMNYRTMDFQEVMSLDLEHGLKPGGLICMWVVNAHIHNLMQVLEERQLTFIKAVTWIKVASSGKLQPVIGHYFQHVCETCMILVKGEFINEVSRQMINNIPDVIRQAKTINSAKPQTLLRILRDTEIQSNKLPLKLVDIFGRGNNLEQGWITVGLDAKQQSVNQVSKT